MQSAFHTPPIPDKRDMEAAADYIACPGCDLLLNRVDSFSGKKLYCPRCDTSLSQKKTDSVSKVLAISTAGLLIYIPAVFMPLLTLHVLGMEQSGSIWDAFLSFYTQQYYLVTVLLFLTSVLFPLLRLSILFSVCLQLKIRLYSKSLFFLFRTAHHLDEWGMADVYLIALLVSIVKIHNVGTLDFNIGFFCFIFLVLMTRATSAALDPEEFWEALDELKKSSSGNT